jgi:hypothetical protein
MTFPADWDRLAQTALAGSYNVQYVVTPERWLFNGFFPDGYAKTIVCPVPVSHLRQCVAWFDHVSQDETIRTPTSAALTLSWSVVNYLEGKSPQAAQDPLDVAMATTRTLGTSLLQLPELQGPAGGSRALTVRRSRQSRGYRSIGYRGNHKDFEMQFKITRSKQCGCGSLGRRR